LKINLRRYIEIEESLLSSLMNKAGLADITYARQGLTLVHFSAQREHILWDTLGA
jgi:hypothetical protein